MDFQKYNREIIEENYLRPNNIPTRTNIDQMNKEIYDLKKVVKDLIQELRELKREKEKGESLAKSETESPKSEPLKKAKDQNR